MTPAEQTRAIIAEVAAKHGVRIDDVLGPSRWQEIVRARDEAIARVKEARPNWTLVRIGALFNRDHSSIAAALDRRRYREKKRAWVRGVRAANMDAGT